MPLNIKIAKLFSEVVHDINCPLELNTNLSQKPILDVSSDDGCARAKSVASNGTVTRIATAHFIIALFTVMQLYFLTCTLF